MTRLSLPQELAATFLGVVNADIVGLSAPQRAAIVRNESSIAQVKPWKIRGLCSADVPGRLGPYIYFWNRQNRKGQRCWMTARGAMNSCRLEFDDGFKMITSRNAIRREK
jgi:hypothetical protein